MRISQITCLAIVSATIAALVAAMPLQIYADPSAAPSEPQAADAAGHETSAYGTFTVPDFETPHMKGSLMVKLAEGADVPALNALLSAIPETASCLVSDEDFLFGWATLSLDEQADLDAVIKALAQHPEVVGDAQLDYVRGLDSRTHRPSKSEYSESDFKEVPEPEGKREFSLFAQSEDDEPGSGAEPLSLYTNDPKPDWGISAVNAPGAWEVVRCANSVTVAVIDSGCVTSHPDLKGNVIAAYDATGKVGIGKDVADHGTHVCGIIAARADNGIGTVGVSYNANILPITIFRVTSDDEVIAPSSAICRAYSFAIANKDKYNIRVANMSFGMDMDQDFGDGVIASPRELELIDKMAASGILPVCASGNAYEEYGGAYDEEPASYNKNGLSVIALDHDSTGMFRASFSNCNYWDGTPRESYTNATISAPGTAVRSTMGKNGYEKLDGTSMATPYVSGVAALVCAANPQLSTAEVKAVIERTAKDLSYIRTYKFYSEYNQRNMTVSAIAGAGYDLETGHGCIDALKAVLDAKSLIAPETPAPEPDSSDPAAEDPAVQAIDLSQVSLSFSHKQVESTASGNIAYYNGSAIKCVPKAYYEGTKLVAGTDYTVAYTGPANFVDAGDYTVTMTGTGNFTGTATYSYTIKKLPLNKAIQARGRTWTPTTSLAAAYPYANKPVTPSFTVKANNKFLKEGRDYKVSYKKNNSLGTAYVTVTGRNNCTGTLKASFKIVKNKSFKNVTVKGVKNVTFKGEEWKFPVKVYDGVKKLVKGRDYKVSYSNNLHAGTGKVTITGLGSYRGHTKTKTFKIARQDLNAKGTTSMTTLISCDRHDGECTYDGKAHVPIFYYAFSADPDADEMTMLYPNKDYKLTFKRNVNAGDLVYTVTGIGDYKGTEFDKERNWIVRRNLSKAQVSLSDMKYTGKQLKPSPKVVLKGKVLKEGKDYKVLYSNNIKVGTAKVTIQGIGNYKGSALGTFRISKK